MRERHATFEEVEEELKRWSFMPGWRFEAVRGFAGDTVVCIHGEVLDSVTAARPVVVTVRRAYPYFLPLDVFQSWLRSLVHEMMAHESDEWLKRDGVAVYDPHASGSW